MKKTELGVTTFQGELADRLEAYLKKENPDIKHFGELRRAIILKALRRFLDQEMPLPSDALTYEGYLKKEEVK